MKFFLGFIFLSLFLNITNLQAKSRVELHNDGVKALQAGGKIIFLRYAYAPRMVENGDNDINYKEKNLKKLIILSLNGKARATKFK